MATTGDGKPATQVDDEEEAIIHLSDFICVPCFGRCRVFPCRFASDAMESAFRLERQSRIAASVKRAGFSLAACFIVVLTVNIWQDSNSDAGMASLHASDEVVYFLRGALIVLSVAAGFLSGWCGERRATCLALVIQILTFTTCTDSIQYRMRCEFHEDISWDSDVIENDSAMLISMCCITSYFFVSIPVRWNVGWPVAISTPLMYTLMLLNVGKCQLISTYTSNLENLNVVVLLTAHGLLCLYGRVTSDALERKQFAQFQRAQSKIVTERVLRYQAEQQLGIDQSSSTGNDPLLRKVELAIQSAESVCSSRESSKVAASSCQTRGTSASGRIVRSLAKDPSKALASIAALAKKEHWKVEMGSIMIDYENMLGRGGFGCVFAGTLYGMPVAVKVPSGGIDGKVDGHKLQSLGNELRMLRRLRHENITTFYGSFIEPQSNLLAVVLELVRGQLLREFLITGPCGCGEDAHATPCDDNCRYLVLRGLCRALMYLHEHVPPIIHGDLKPQNVMVDVVGPCSFRTEARTKLLDFGLSRCLGRNAKAKGFSKSWAAPEVLRGDVLHPAGDVYAFGRMAYYIVTFTGKQASPKSTGLQWPASTLGVVCKDESEACMSEKPSDRPTMARIHVVMFPLDSDGDAAEGEDPDSPPLLNGSVDTVARDRLCKETIVESPGATMPLRQSL